MPKSEKWRTEAIRLRLEHRWGAPRIHDSLTRNWELVKETGEDPPVEKTISLWLRGIPKVSANQTPRVEGDHLEHLGYISRDILKN